MLVLYYPAEHNSTAIRAVATFIVRERLGLEFVMEASGRNSYLLCLNGKQLTVADAFFTRATRSWLSTSSMPDVPLSRWKLESELDAVIVDDSLPVLFGNPGFRIDALGNGHLELDVFGSAFFMLYRYEEAILQERDAHDRFPAKASVAFKEGFLDRPLIDEYVGVLRAAMLRIWPRLAPRTSHPRTILTHDVDAPSLFALKSPMKVIRSAAGDLLRRRSMREASRRLWVWSNSRRHIHAADPYNNFDWMMETSEKYGMKSAFYFICGQTDPRFDGEYKVAHPAIRELLRRIHVRSHEIGLHPSYGTYRSAKAISSEAEFLRRVCTEEKIQQSEWGGRMHYLRWKLPATLYGWEEAKMSYDSTLSYADRAGFRCGTCYEYSAFDPVGMKALNLRIRPLIAMECTVMDRRYMGLGTSSSAYDKFIELKSKCRRVGGAFTLLWHNTRLVLPRERELYEAVLTG